MRSRDWSADECSAVLKSVTGDGPVLRALQAVQAHFGYVPTGAVEMVAEQYNVSRADVFGVLTFYSDLRTTPPAAVEITVCMGEACQAVGARDLMAQVESGASPDRDVSHGFCFGNCALGPTVVVNDRLIGRATAASVLEAVDGR